MINRRGFSIFFMFLVIMLILFASLFAHSQEILSIGRMQSFYLKKTATIVPMPQQIALPEQPDAGE